MRCIGVGCIYVFFIYSITFANEDLSYTHETSSCFQSLTDVTPSRQLCLNTLTLNHSYLWLQPFFVADPCMDMDEPRLAVNERFDVIKRLLIFAISQ